VSARAQTFEVPVGHEEAPANGEDSFDFTALDLTREVHGEVLQRSARGNVKFRLHRFEGDSRCFLLLALAIPREDPSGAAKVLEGLNLGIYDRMFSPQPSLDPCEWVRWIRGIEAAHGCSTPLGTWVGIWRLDDAKVRWAGDGIPSMLQLETGEPGTVEFQYAGGQSLGEWNAPRDRNLQFYFGAPLLAPHGGEPGEPPSIEKSPALEAMCLLGAPTGQLIIRLRSCPIKRGRSILHEVPSIGETLRKILADAQECLWEKQDQEAVVLQLGSAILKHTEWDRAFHCVRPCHLSWEIDPTNLSYFYFKDGMLFEEGAISRAPHGQDGAPLRCTA